MTTSGESIAAPLVRGVGSALAALGTALALVVVPALAAQLAAGGSSLTALDAILLALNLLVLGHGGGLVVDTGVVVGAVSLTPLGLTLVLVAVSGLAAGRAGRALDPVGRDGLLRPRALRDAAVLLTTHTVLYAAGTAVLAGAARSAAASPVVGSALVSGALVAVVGAVTGLLWSLRRPATETVPGVRVLDLLPAPFDTVARAAAIALLGLLASGTALVLVLVLTHVPGQAALFEALRPGVVGGGVLTLLQLTLFPLLVVWALVVLLGGTVTLGTGTGLDLDAVSTGVLPALPLLAALPQPGDLPPAARALMLVPLVPLVLGAWRLVRDTAGAPVRDRVVAAAAYPVVVVVTVLLLAGLSTGRIGEGRLVALGPALPTLLLPLAGLAVLATGVVVGMREGRVPERVRGLVARLRDRVETAERAEHDPDPRPEGGAPEGGAPEDDAPEDDAPAGGPPDVTRPSR